MFSKEKALSKSSVEFTSWPPPSRNLEQMLLTNNTQEELASEV
jgi:hypothetical protein